MILVKGKMILRGHALASQNAGSPATGPLITPDQTFTYEQNQVFGLNVGESDASGVTYLGKIREVGGVLFAKNATLKSLNNGVTWVAVDNHPNPAGLSDWDVGNGKIMLLSYAPGASAAYVSADGGNSWSNYPILDPINSDPYDGNPAPEADWEYLFYAGSDTWITMGYDGAGCGYTNDGGVTWATATLPPHADPSWDNSWYNGTYNPADGAIIMHMGSEDTAARSTNGGATWEAITLPSGFTPDTYWEYLHCSPSGQWILNAEDKLAVSTDNGSTWELKLLNVTSTTEEWVYDTSTNAWLYATSGAGAEASGIYSTSDFLTYNKLFTIPNGYYYHIAHAATGAFVVNGYSTEISNYRTVVVQDVVPVLGAVLASDANEVIDFRFSATNSQVSSDGNFSIGSDGVIYMTEDGSTGPANDYFTPPNSFTESVQAKNDLNAWGPTETVTLQVLSGDILAPEIQADQTFSHPENYTNNYDSKGGAWMLTETVVATDNVAVTDFRFTASGTSTSSDGNYYISPTGQIGVKVGAPTASDYETLDNEHIYQVQAKDVKGNWSSPVSITITETNVVDSGPAITPNQTIAFSPQSSSGVIGTLSLAGAEDSPIVSASFTNAYYYPVMSGNGGASQSVYTVDVVTGDVTVGLLTKPVGFITNPFNSLEWWTARDRWQSTGIESIVPAPLTESSGKWYVEMQVTEYPIVDGRILAVGVGDSSLELVNKFSGSSQGWAFAPKHCLYRSDGAIISTSTLSNGKGTTIATVAGYTLNDVIGILFDADTNTIEFKKNNVTVYTATAGAANNTAMMPVAVFGGWNGFSMPTVTIHHDSSLLINGVVDSYTQTYSTPSSYNYWARPSPFNQPGTQSLTLSVKNEAGYETQVPVTITIS